MESVIAEFTNTLPCKRDVLASLNSYLADRSYLVEYTVSQVDVSVFEVIKDGTDLSECPHVMRWHKHIASFDEAERRQLKLHSGGGSKLTGKESPMDLWMLSRIAAAVESCNKAFETYEFPLATTACYNLWLYDLCDVYLEYLKPVFQAGDSDTVYTAKNTLYTCLNVGVRLLAPFMPFITEELFQRLPKSAGNMPSICVTPYPEVEDHLWRSLQIETEVDFVQKVVRLVRSARSDYTLPNKVKTEAYVLSSDEATSDIVRKFISGIATLSYCSKVELCDKPPIGCAVLTVSDKCEVHLLLKGLIEPAKELAKLQKKREFLEQQVTKLNQSMAASDYMTKVPEDFRLANSEKLTQAGGEIERLQIAMAALKTME